MLVPSRFRFIWDIILTQFHAQNFVAKVQKMGVFFFICIGLVKKRIWAHKSVF